MKYLSGAPLALIFHVSLSLVSFCAPTHLSAAEMRPLPQMNAALATAPLWQSTSAEHVYGFPDVRPNKKGSLTLSAETLRFSGKSGDVSIPRSSVTAVSAGNQRVELWGLGGRILRMTIPDGGGLAAAAVMHHRVDMLTVEFNDNHGGNHGAVFFLPANEADRALENFALTRSAPQRVSDTACHNGAVDPRSVLVTAPNWDRAEVPAAYRALVYEHAIDRLRHAKEAMHVYRDGEAGGNGACPQYVIHISIAAFKQGSSVQRAVLGPVGMFVGTTQMVFDVTYTDASGRLNVSEQIKATMRGESESTNVADHVASSLAKHYAAALKNANKSNPAKTTYTPAS